ncbi:CatB-related O-acetyltransferase [Cetobacterium somerae]|uniref:CatB-related O-acetyltransferase n=1 Tax=Cetobacterium somerae TaxID=188913 RepID=UPI001F066708|nr:CatB-related O-acetyltransferase [Cetobacterium somerae]UPO97396.1 CatB-related O-acetyltransferase [Cetobacterium somerae]
MIREILQKYKLKGKKVFLEKKVNFKKASFEGANRVGMNSSIRKIKIGYGSYIGKNCMLNAAKVGKFCSLGNNIKIISGNHPTKDYVSTHPFCYSTTFKREGLNFQKHIKFDDLLKIDNNTSIVIGNDVWIGDNVLILGGIKIGDGVVIGCGSVITRDIEAYSIVVGVPGKVLRKRFTDKQIQFLEEFKWWNKEIEWIEKNIENFSNIEKLMANEMVRS